MLPLSRSLDTLRRVIIVPLMPWEDASMEAANWHTRALDLSGRESAAQAALFRKIRQLEAPVVAQRVVDAWQSTVADGNGTLGKSTGAARLLLHRASLAATRAQTERQQGLERDLQLPQARSRSRLVSMQSDEGGAAARAGSAARATGASEAVVPFACIAATGAVCIASSAEGGRTAPESLVLEAGGALRQPGGNATLLRGGALRTRADVAPEQPTVCLAPAAPASSEPAGESRAVTITPAAVGVPKPAMRAVRVRKDSAGQASSSAGADRASAAPVASAVQICGSAAPGTPPPGVSRPGSLPRAVTGMPPSGSLPPIRGGRTAARLSRPSPLKPARQRQPGLARASEAGAQPAGGAINGDGKVLALPPAESVPGPPPHRGWGEAMPPHGAEGTPSNAAPAAPRQGRPAAEGASSRGVVGRDTPSGAADALPLKTPTPTAAPEEHPSAGPREISTEAVVQAPDTGRVDADASSVERLPAIGIRRCRTRQMPTQADPKTAILPSHESAATTPTVPEGRHLLRPLTQPTSPSTLAAPLQDELTTSGTPPSRAVPSACSARPAPSLQQPERFGDDIELGPNAALPRGPEREDFAPLVISGRRDAQSQGLSPRASRERELWTGLQRRGGQGASPRWNRGEPHSPGSAESTSSSDDSQMTAIVVSSPLEGVIGLPATLQTPIEAVARPAHAAAAASRARRASNASMASAPPSEAGLESVVSWIDGLQVRAAKRPYRERVKQRHQRDTVWRLCMEFSNPGRSGPDKISIVWGPVSSSRQQAETWAASLIALRKLRRRLRAIASAWAHKVAERIAQRKAKEMASGRAQNSLLQAAHKKNTTANVTSPDEKRQPPYRQPPPPPPPRSKPPPHHANKKLPKRRPPPPPPRKQ